MGSSSKHRRSRIVSSVSFFHLFGGAGGGGGVAGKGVPLAVNCSQIHIEWHPLFPHADTQTEKSGSNERGATVSSFMLADVWHLPHIQRNCVVVNRVEPDSS